MEHTVKTGNYCSSIVAGGKLDFIGQVLCPMKGTFSEGYSELIEEHVKNGGRNLYSYVPTVCGGGKKAGEAEPDPGEVLKYITIGDFPDIAASFGYGDYFCSAFRDRFLGKGNFAAPERTGINRLFEHTGIEDPDGEFYIYSGYPVVFMIDRKKLGGLPVPHTWQDLLNPVYRKNITIGGGHGKVSATVPLHVYKNFGEMGLDKFEANVAQAMHPSEMVRLAGTENANNTAIYTILYFFGKAAGEKKNVELIWPEDGAVFEPAFFLLKKDKEEEYRFLIDYIAGKKYGELSAKNGFPVTCPGIDNRLPPEAKLQWPGWNFIKSHKMEEVSDMVCAQFQKYMVQP